MKEDAMSSVTRTMESFDLRRTDLNPDELGQGTDELGGGVDAQLHGLFVHDLADG